jgi:hypothetical protein
MWPLRSIAAYVVIYCTFGSEDYKAFSYSIYIRYYQVWRIFRQSHPFGLQLPTRIFNLLPISFLSKPGIFWFCLFAYIP